MAALQKRIDGLKYQDGKIDLHHGLAHINLPTGYRYLDETGAATVLSEIWGNPRGDGTLGLIVPAKFNPLDDSSWAVVITYDEDGHVKDDDAASIDYTKLLKEMQEGMHDANEERTKQGYPAVELIGWAAPPRYDAAAHKLYWAKEIKFGDSPEHTLNYNIRLLGRRGVLILNAVAGMKDLKQVEAATPAILAMVDFQEGHRYADFNHDTDKVATYGIAALVAGGIAAKAGFFKLLWVGILAFKKVILMALFACAGFFKKGWDWIRGRRQKSAFASTDSSDPTPPAST